MWSFTYIVLCSLIYLCGAEDDGKIVGGTAIDISQAPYQISFRYNNNHFCGGTIIGAKYVVTAAHCLKDLNNVAGLTIVAGQTKLKDTDGQQINVTKMTPNPKYNEKTLDYDVAVLELAEELKFNNKVQPLPLSKNKAPLFGSVFITGWGTTKAGGGGAVSDQLMGATVPIQLKAACQLEYLLTAWLTDRMFCAGHLFGGQDSCQGDSGGPAENNRELVGIVSFGRGCANIFAPGVYTQVSVVRDFIMNAMA